MNIFQKIKILNKLNKAYKDLKRLIDTKKGLADEVKNIIIEIRALVQKLVKLSPECKDIYIELENIIRNAF